MFWVVPPFRQALRAENWRCCSRRWQSKAEVKNNCFLSLEHASCITIVGCSSMFSIILTYVVKAACCFKDVSHHYIPWHYMGRVFTAMQTSSCEEIRQLTVLSTHILFLQNADKLFTWWNDRFCVTTCLSSCKSLNFGLTSYTVWDWSGVQYCAKQAFNSVLNVLRKFKLFLDRAITMMMTMASCLLTACTQPGRFCAWHYFSSFSTAVLFHAHSCSAVRKNA